MKEYGTILVQQILLSMSAAPDFPFPKTVAVKEVSN
jgi:hypothetical protein